MKPKKMPKTLINIIMITIEKHGKQLIPPTK